AFGRELVDGDSAGGEAGGGGTDGRANVGIDGDGVELLPHSETRAFDIGSAERDGRGEGIFGIMRGEDGEEQPEVFGGARHGAHGSEHSAGITEGGEVAGAGDAAGSRLEAGDAAEV